MWFLPAREREKVVLLNVIGQETWVVMRFVG